MSFLKKQYDDEDDGRVIMEMDVEGMPWYDRRPHREKDALPKSEQPARPAHFTSGLSKMEARLYTRYSMLAGFGLSMVFVVTWVLFTLFCTEIWFR